jgi:hypothetical protein
MNDKFERIARDRSSAEILSQHLLKGTEGNHANLMMADVLDEIRTEQPPKRNPEHYH